MNENLNEQFVEETMEGVTDVAVQETSGSGKSKTVGILLGAATIVGGVLLWKKVIKPGIEKRKAKKAAAKNATAHVEEVVVEATEVK